MPRPKATPSPAVHAVPAPERWLWANRVACTAARDGLAELGRGDTVFLGSFAEHADDDADCTNPDAPIL